MGNLCKNVGLINSCVSSNVKLLQTCGSNKRKREKEDPNLVVAKNDRVATSQKSMQHFFKRL